MKDPEPLALERRAASLAARAGFRGRLRLVPLPGGTNNRVYRCEGDGFRALLKRYFRHRGDSRNRLGAEFGFCRFAWERGIRCVARPLARDASHGLGLYEFIPGTAIRGETATRGWVRCATDFFVEVNRYRGSAAAAQLPSAADACFSLANHLGCVERRLRRLVRAPENSAEDRDAARFIRQSLIPAWERASERTRTAARAMGWRLGDTLSARDRCLSPSDFGFHNAIRTPEGKLKFVDFEYAGWDDPAKAVCDFFSIGESPVLPDLYGGMADEVARHWPQPERLRRRMDLVLPLHRLKWCCILLNDFLPAEARRRRFAGQSPERDKKREQIEKARRAFRAFEECATEWPT